ncbi:TetR/AcrR family transcriptional regulator [Pseudonocardia sp. GCM10023141]|uniref:TetR/AcrR family transcriptional regulator n=1 Tax=Pseudonocardia sp. GCM10023141 TaxID=3252653 RepID=UPI00361CDC31
MATTTRARSARADRTAATRRRITDAAAPLFVESGYLDTTMAGLAKAAGVAVQTLYLSFGSKAAVLEGALAGAAEDHPSGWLEQLAGEPDGTVALARYVAQAAVVLERQHPLAAVLRAAAADPEPADLLVRTRAAALAQHAAAIDELAEKPGFTLQITVARATEIMATLLSAEAFGLLVVEHSWAAADWADWTNRHLAADLFPTVSEQG